MGDFARSTDPAVQVELDLLDKLSPGRDVLGLERITALLDALGRPQDRLPPVFHVAGTNGKGSTCAFLRAGLEASGYRVHVFTSPHLVRFNERIRIAGNLVGDDELAALLGRVRAASGDIHPSFFEATTAAAFCAFADHPADAAVIEVGLGGRLDATNVVAAPIVTGIAAIGHDHHQFLGDDLAGIAGEKAGIAKPGVPLVSLAQPDVAQQRIVAVAAERGARLLLEGRDWSIDPSLVPLLPGPHQLRNANLAFAMLASQDALAVSRRDFRQSLASATWPARFQRLDDGPLTNGLATWLDGAHNAEAAAALAATLAEQGPMHLVLGILANKDAAAVVDVLRPYALSFTFVPVADHEHHEPITLQALYGGRAAGSLAEALDGLPGPRLIAGSLYLAGEALAENRQIPD
jgi:dihydrofolate synthase/folylpolyglutamate synthase